MPIVPVSRSFAHQRPRVSRFLLSLLAAVRYPNLQVLATLAGTDKWGEHWYTQHYQRVFAPFRNRRMNVLEIGVGGYADSLAGAASLRMWKAYFPNSQIVGIDLYDKSALAEPRIDILQCDQTDEAKLRSISESYGGFDIIIDDGSHLNEHIIQTFGILFPLLRVPGIYAVEDLQTAYWPSWGGVPGKSAMDFLRSLTDCPNYSERPAYSPTYFDRFITSVSFFHNLCIITKDANDERSNAPQLIERELIASQP